MNEINKIKSKINKNYKEISKLNSLMEKERVKIGDLSKENMKLETEIKKYNQFANLLIKDKNFNYTDDGFINYVGSRKIAPQRFNIIELYESYGTNPNINEIMNLIKKRSKRK